MKENDDLIYRQDAIDALAEHEKSRGHNYSMFVDVVSECAEIVRDVPPIEAVPVVRCKDCKHLSVRSGALGAYQCAIHGDYPSGEYFCADGKKRDENECYN